MNAAFAPPDREEALDRMARTPLDVLVVGGGITGAGIALDAMTRGYRTALVERDDLASGTSSRSSKLVHGGIRYLSQGDLPMVVEGVRERDRLRRLAPHLVHPVPFAIPAPSSRRWAELKIGMLLYDAFAFGRNVHRHHGLDHGRFLRAAPGLVRGNDRGYRYVDCQTDDARLTLTVALTARRHGALIANHAEVVDLLESRGQVVGARVADGLTGETLDVSARWVVSATGVWADRVRRLAADPGAPRLVPSRGVHLTFPRSLLPVNGAVSFPSGLDDGRMVFVVPWGGQVYVGTTDEVHTDPVDASSVGSGDAEYLTASISSAFGVDVSVRDAIGAWAGLRPLMAGSDGLPPTDLSRRHAVVPGPPGLVTVTGGKLTTYRQMAEDVVDELARADGNSTRCHTKRLPLGTRDARGVLSAVAVARRLGYDDAVGRTLYARHGDAAPVVLEACRRWKEDSPLVPGLPYLTGEVRWSVRHELARTLADVLDRRLRVSVRDRAAGGAGIAASVAVLAEELGWDPARQEQEVAEYLRQVRTERGPVPLDDGWRS